MHFGIFFDLFAKFGSLALDRKSKVGHCSVAQYLPKCGESARREYERAFVERAAVAPRAGMGATLQKSKTKSAISRPVLGRVGRKSMDFVKRKFGTWPRGRPVVVRRLTGTQFSWIFEQTRRILKIWEHSSFFNYWKKTRRILKFWEHSSFFNYWTNA